MPILCMVGLGAGRYGEGTRVLCVYARASPTSRAGVGGVGGSVRRAALARPPRSSVSCVGYVECVRAPTRCVAHAGAPPGDAQAARLRREGAYHRTGRPTSRTDPQW